jgi:hypothetical protein
MINPTREQVAVAIFNLVSSVAGIVYSSRRPQEFSAVPIAQMPALYMGNMLEEYKYLHGTASPAIITLTYDFWIYVNVQDPNLIPDTIINNLLDAVEAALAPVPYGSPGAVQTLGLAGVNHAWMEDLVFRAPGYLDGQGQVRFTVKVLVPQ